MAPYEIETKPETRKFIIIHLFHTASDRNMAICIK